MHSGPGRVPQGDVRVGYTEVAMKHPRRGLRVALSAGALGLAAVAGTVVCNWSVVRDHLEAWRFRSREDTEMIAPDPAFIARAKYPGGHGYLVHGTKDLLSMLAASSGRPVLVDRAGLTPRFLLGLKDATAERALDTLASAGYRILEQRFPRAAYVVVGYPPARVEGPPAGAPSRLSGGVSTAIELKAGG
jgi:hypothetical protein